MIKSYNHFLLESVLKASDDFKSILLRMKQDKVALALLELLDEDIKTVFNGLSLSDKNDTISFTSDSQFQRKISMGQSLKDIMNTTRDKTSIGRIATKILSDNNIKVTGPEIETFVHKFKGLWDSSYSKKGKDNIRVISGEEIKYWYFERNYCMDTLTGRGTLGKSCMRHSYCQDFFQIYIDNPEVCKMLIYTDFENGEEVLRARVLIWQTNLGGYVDRVYYTEDSEETLLIDWAQNNLNCKLDWRKDSARRMEVQLKEPSEQYIHFPFLDSLAYYYGDENKLRNFLYTFDGKQTIFYCQDSSGGYKDYSTVYCSYIDTYVNADSADWSEYLQSYIPSDSSIFSESYDDYLFKPDSVEAITSYSGVTDWFPDDSDDIVKVNIDGKEVYYVKKLVNQYKGKLFVMSESLFGYEINENGEGKFKEYFNIPDYEKGPFLISEDAAKCLGIDHDEERIVFWKKEYFRRTYKYIVFKQFYKKVPALGRAKRLLLMEINEADKYLREENLFYRYHNIIEDAGGFEDILDKINFDDEFVNRFDLKWNESIAPGQEEKVKSQAYRIMRAELFEFFRCFTKPASTVLIDTTSPELEKYKRRFMTLGICSESTFDDLIKFIASTIGYALSMTGIKNPEIQEQVSAIIYFLDKKNIYPK